MIALCYWLIAQRIVQEADDDRRSPIPDAPTAGNDDPRPMTARLGARRERRRTLRCRGLARRCGRWRRRHLGAAWRRAGRRCAAEVRFPTDLTAGQVETLLGHIAGLSRGVAISVHGGGDGRRPALRLERAVRPVSSARARRCAASHPRLVSRRATRAPAPASATACGSCGVVRGRCCGLTSPSTPSPACSAGSRACDRASGCVWWSRCGRPAVSADRSSGQRTRRHSGAVGAARVRPTHSSPADGTARHPDQAGRPAPQGAASSSRLTPRRAGERSICLAACRRRFARVSPDAGAFVGASAEPGSSASRHGRGGSSEPLLSSGDRA